MQENTLTLITPKLEYPSKIKIFPYKNMIFIGQFVCSNMLQWSDVGGYDKCASYQRENNAICKKLRVKFAYVTNLIFPVQGIQTSRGNQCSRSTYCFG